MRRGDPTGVPHSVKARVVRDRAAAYGIGHFIETGTCHGAMVEAVAGDFLSIDTIEFYEPNFLIAQERLARFPHVRVHLGDSADVLGKLIVELVRPALVFLDAHYSGPGTGRAAVDTPVVSELRTLSCSPFANVIVIDDARLFAGEPWHTDDFSDYPSFAEIEELVSTFQAPSAVRREADEFVIVPAG